MDTIIPYYKTWIHAGSLLSFGLLFLRIVVGLAFIKHGAPKIKAPTAWMGPNPPMPKIALAIAAFSEFAGGIAILFGVLTPLAAIGILFTMLGALRFHLSMKHPFVASEGPSYELVANYIAIAIVLIALGGGRYSIDALLLSAF